MPCKLRVRGSIPRHSTWGVGPGPGRAGEQPGPGAGDGYGTLPWVNVPQLSGRLPDTDPLRRQARMENHWPDGMG
ncbi:hypothetical protein GCM10009687_36420 [Asanoa iriomotensis]